MKAFAFVVFAALVCAVAFGEDHEGYSGDCKFEIKGGVLTIKPDSAESCDMDEYSPSSPNPFVNYNDDIGKIVVEAGVNAITTYAFAGCSHFTEIEVKCSTVNIGPYAFSDCSGMTKFSTGEGTSLRPVELVDDYAFQNTNKLRNITLKSNNCTMGDSVFSNSGLELVVIKGGSISTLGKTFSGMPKLRTLVLPKVYEFTGSVFSNCPVFDLLYYMGSEDLCGEDESIFGQGCDSLQDVVVPTYYNSTLFCTMFPKKVSTTTSDAVSNVAVRALVALTMLVAVLLA